MTSFAMCEAMRSISKDRLLNPLGTVGTRILADVENILKMLLEIE